MFSVKEGDRGGLITYFSLLKGTNWAHEIIMLSVFQLSELYNFKGYII
jgi:hypothetical protein